MKWKEGEGEGGTPKRDRNGTLMGNKKIRVKEKSCWIKQYEDEDDEKY